MTDKLKFESGEPAAEFSVMVNLAMAHALENGADVDVMAAIAANAAHELYECYGAGEEYDSFQELAIDSAFLAVDADQELEDQGE